MIKRLCKNMRIIPICDFCSELGESHLELVKGGKEVKYFPTLYYMILNQNFQVIYQLLFHSYS